MGTTAADPGRTLAALCGSAFLWAFSFGVIAALASPWLSAAGVTETVIGLNTGVYYGGIALAAGLVPWLLRRWGRGCTVLGMVGTGLTVALFPWGGGLAGWFALRLVNGAAAAMSLIPLETLVNHNAAPGKRARDFGCYAFCVALGMALGNLVGLQLYTGLPYLAFGLGGLAGVLAGVVVVAWLPSRGMEPEPAHARTPVGFRENYISFGSAWAQGFLEGGMVGFLTLYLLTLRFSADAVSWLVSGTMVGVIAAQVPVAWLADRLGRTPVLLGCYIVTGVGLVCLPFCTGAAGLAVWLFLVGACSGAFYPLGLAVLGERLPPAALPRASAWYLGINCLGSLVGPVLMGKAIDLFGWSSLFSVAEASLVLVLASWAVLRLIGERKASDRRDEPDGSAVHCDAA